MCCKGSLGFNVALLNNIVNSNAKYFSIIDTAPSIERAQKSRLGGRREELMMNDSEKYAMCARAAEIAAKAAAEQLHQSAVRGHVKSPENAAMVIADAWCAAWRKVSLELWPVGPAAAPPISDNPVGITASDPLGQMYQALQEGRIEESRLDGRHGKRRVVNDAITETVEMPLSRNQLVQDCCAALLRHLAGADVDEAKAVIEWLQMKITRANAIIMEAPVDTSEFPPIGG